MNKEQGLSRRAFVGRVAAGAAGGALAISVAGSASALSTGRKVGAGASLGTPAETGGEAALEAVETAPVEAVPAAVSSPAAPAPWQLVQPLSAGSALTEQWSVADLSGIVGGACVLTLSNQRGREHRVHICRNGGTPQGLVYTDKFDLVVMNGGRGDLPTEEDFGHAVAAVAHAIAANEGRGAEISGLLPQSEREERFAAAAHLR